MSEPATDPHTRPTPEPRMSAELDATLLQEELESQPVVKIGTHTVSKQECDLAFAAALLRTGWVTERRLAAVAKSWTAFGAASLADHIVACGLLSIQKANEIEQSAQSLLTRLADRTATNGSAATDSTKWLVDLDPDGRLAKLLGIADSSMMQGIEVQDRQVDARYTLLRKLGQGGLGVVWLARDENLQRYVAIKEINRDIAPDDVALEHFRREAEITGRLEHPGIVPIYQYGRDETTGKVFYVMRFLGRKTLQDALSEYHERRGLGNDDPMALHRMLTAFVSICQSVGHAHSRRVIHRDLKPANIALDRFDKVTLLDWGLAKVNDETGVYNVNGRTEPADLHSTGSLAAARVIGTPLYMAPEQAAGRLDEVDELTDIYGLGGILYAILTGVGPHQSTVESLNTHVAATEILSRIVSQPVPAPQTVRPSVSPELNAICLKALSTKRYLRYETATELAEDVQRYMAGTPVTAYEAPMKRRLSRWMANHPTLAQSLMLLISLVVVAGLIVAFAARQGRQSLIDARYASVKESARDLQIHLKLEANELERDLRFITELPLMQAITQSQRGLTASDATPDRPAAENQSSQSIDQPADSAGADGLYEAELRLLSPKQWLRRQGDLFAGLLNANPSYLMMTSCIRQPDFSYRELVRTERIAAGQRTMQVPRKQLLISSPSDDSEANFELLEAMRPGVVVLVTNDQIAPDVPTNHRSPLVLSGISAVHDSDGEFFGINVIELDLRHRLEQLLSAEARENVDVRITDANGITVMRYENGKITDLVNEEQITQEIPQLKDFYTADSKLMEIGDGKTFFATRVQLGSTGERARIGIVTRILEPR
ncbi:serine/threonine protein kinase [Stieleria sp. TO1_6]|uniref:serine/threonine-protein kinase n=1 Tax=Stieleria tagensis TaxID=2956795 RepID=UPI00209AC375|nr:serine/threonine-protein kinase [Stieleria tagensis]MCO8122134.1 serine/threonine protein kinase [Stieleria tagensis]